MLYRRGVAVAIILVTLVFLTVPTPLSWPGVPALLMLASQILCCAPWTRMARRWWLLVAQCALFALGGQPSFLAASVLLIITGRVRWVLFAAVVAATGLLNVGTDLYTWANAMGNTATQGLLVFALTRLSDLRGELRATREELAEQTVVRERERAGGDLSATLGSALSDIVGLAVASRTADVLALARRTANQVRQVPAPVRMPAPSDLTPRLAVPILIVVYLWIPIIGSVLIGQAGTPVAHRAGYIAALVMTVVLQAHHFRPRPPDVRPRYVEWTLPFQVLLGGFALAVPGHAYPEPLGWAAASILVVLPSRFAWPIFAMVAASVPAVIVLRSGTAAEAANGAFETVSTAVLFYGLALLTQLVYEVRMARAALAALAVTRERRRVSRDVHDFLGSSLSAVIVKAELALREPGRAGAELIAITRIARRARSELGALVEDDTPGLSLDAELVSARESLAAAGITTEINVDRRRLPDAVDTLLAVALREAVTNMLRHSRPTRGTISVTSAARLARLCVTNDGAPAAASAPQGQGIANLTTRVAATGGGLTARRTGDDRYELAVWHPIRPQPAATREAAVPTPSNA